MVETRGRTYRLFKYRSISDDISRSRTRRIVADRRIYYASPNQFNDPFDCDVCLCMDDADLHAMGFRGSDDVCSKLKAHSENWLRNEAVKHYAVLSLSTVNDNLLMWSHYADCHRGVCLEFKFEATEPLYQIEYSSKRPILYFADFDERERDDERFHRTLINILTAKAVDWAYEQEWRCIDTVGCGERAMPSDMLTGVIFGCRTPDDDKALVRDWVASGGQRVTFYQATQKDGAFALEIKRLDC